MRRFWIAVPMMLLCLLCACGGKETSPLQAPMDFRVSLLQAGGCRVKLEGTADTSDRIWEFALEANLQTDGTADLTLIRPEGVAGITAHLEGASGRLGCEEVSVEFGIPEDERLAPAAVPSTLILAWAEGYLASAGPDGTEILAVYELGYDADAVRVETWFDATGTPVRAELGREGKTGIRLNLSNFELYSGGSYEAVEEDLGGRVPGQSGP